MEQKELSSLNEAALQVQLNEAAPTKPIRQSQVRLALQGEPDLKVKKRRSMKQRLERPRQHVPGETTLVVRDGQVIAIDKGTEKPKDVLASSVQYTGNDLQEVEIPDMVLEYFDVYFGDNLNEDTSDEDIMNAVEDLVDLCESVCDAVVMDEAKKKPPVTAADYNNPENFYNKAIGQGFNPPRKPDIFGDRPRKPTPLGGAFNRRAKGQRIGKFIDKHLMRPPENLTDTDLEHQQASTKRHADAWKERQKSNAENPDANIFSKAVESGGTIPKFSGRKRN